MNPVGWFEIPVIDLDRAKTFYETVFETTLTNMRVGAGEMETFPMEMGAPQAAGGLMKAPGYTPSQDGTIVYFTATDLDAHTARAQVAGGKILLPKTSIGEHGFIAHITDTEGNRIALHSREG